MMMIINQIFITVFLLSVAGTVVGITFLALQSILYKHTSAEFLVRINKAVILAFVIPVFYALGMMDRTNYYLSEYDMLVLVEQGSITDKLYAFRDMVGFADKISLIWLAGLGLFLLFYAVSNAIFAFRISESSREIESGRWREQFHTLPVQWASGGSDQTPVLDMDETDMHSWFDKQKDHYTGTIVGYAERNGKRHYFEA